MAQMTFKNLPEELQEHIMAALKDSGMGLWTVYESSASTSGYITDIELMLMEDGEDIYNIFITVERPDEYPRMVKAFVDALLDTDELDLLVTEYRDEERADYSDEDVEVVKIEIQAMM